jgi:hypothetical protein
LNVLEEKKNNAVRDTLTKKIKLGVPGKTKSLFTHLLFLIIFSWSTILTYLWAEFFGYGTKCQQKFAALMLFSNHVI